MTFEFPGGLYFLAVIPIVLALYMLRVRPREQTLPSLLLWTQALNIQARPRWFGKIRAWLSLLLQLLILLLLILAICRPQGLSPTANARVIVLDLRSRMEATDPFGQSAFSKAQRFAEAYVEGAREGSPIAIVAVAEKPRLISAFSNDPKRLRQALAELEPEKGGGDWTEAIEFAQGIATALTGSPEILALTDRPQDSGAANPALFTVGAPADNVGFTAAGIREANGLASIYLQATSSAKTSREVQLEIEQAGRLIEARKLTLNPKESADLNLEFPTGKEPFNVRLAPPDSMKSDQFVQLTPTIRPPLRALLVSTGNWFVEKALRADEQLQFEMLAPENWDAQISAAFDVTIFDQKVPATFAPHGRFIFLNCAPIPDQGIAADPAVAEFDSAHPLLRIVKPDRWKISEQRVVPPSANVQPIVTGTHGPLVLTSESETCRWAAILFPFDKSDLPLRASFPIFLQDLITWTNQSSRTPSSVIAPLDAEGTNLQLATTSAPKNFSTTNWTGLSEWRWLALAAFGLLLLEWRTYHRRYTE